MLEKPLQFIILKKKKIKNTTIVIFLCIVFKNCLVVHFLIIIIFNFCFTDKMN